MWRSGQKSGCARETMSGLQGVVIYSKALVIVGNSVGSARSFSN